VNVSREFGELPPRLLDVAKAAKALFDPALLLAALGLRRSNRRHVGQMAVELG
jgi:hypothetical protein